MVLPNRRITRLERDVFLDGGCTQPHRATALPDDRGPTLGLSLLAKEGRILASDVQLHRADGAREIVDELVCDCCQPRMAMTQDTGPDSSTVTSGLSSTELNERRSWSCTKRPPPDRTARITYLPPPGWEEAAWRARFPDAYLAAVRDAQGDVVSPEEIERAAHRFLVEGGGVAEMHGATGAGDVVESFIARDNDPHFAPGAWVLGVRLRPEAWERVRRGELTGFSVGGRGVRVPVAVEGGEPCP